MTQPTEPAKPAAMPPAAAPEPTQPTEPAKPFGGKGDHDGDGKPGGTVAKKMITMTLKRHYVPKGEYEVISRAEHEQPGVGYPNKLWAGSVIKVPEDEARDMRAKEIAERSFDD